MRTVFGILFMLIELALAVCAVLAKRSGREIGKAAAALLHYTFTYCRISWQSKLQRNLVYGLLLVDVVQLLLNPVFHHAFEIHPIKVDGLDYYQMTPLLGQQFHRLVDYGLLAGIIVIFVFRVIRTPRLQKERYAIILAALIVISLWETAYIFSGSPIDRSMIGFGVFGLLVFYFSIYYRPMRLLDRTLSNVVSEKLQPMYIFDDQQHCIWMNRMGQEFLKLGPEETDKAGNALEAMEKKLYEAQHDRLTGLFNRDYLYARTRELLAEHPEKPYLAVHAEISGLKLINDLYGNAFGDHALKLVADWLLENKPEGCVCGRLGGDSFGVCIAESEFDQARIEEILSDFLVTDGDTKFHMLVHMGVYRIQDRKLDVSVMYDRAQMAMETVQDDYHIPPGMTSPCGTRWSGTGSCPTSWRKRLPTGRSAPGCSRWWTGKGRPSGRRCWCAGSIRRRGSDRPCPLFPCLRRTA